MEAVIFVGIQAVGKSTFFKERFFNTHMRLNMDMLHTRHRETLLLTAFLEAKQPFVVDNTNPTRADRTKYIQLARAKQFTVTGYFFESTLNEALKRNAHRIGKAQIAEIGIRATYKRLEIPTLLEGFNKIFTVTISPTGGFIVAERDN